MNTTPVKRQSENGNTFLAFPDGRRIAYRLSEGASPAIVFLGGFHSDMGGSKAMAVEAFCRARGQCCLCFDYTGHGQSSGAFTDGTIGQWLQDALDVIEHLLLQEIILVGSSMGAWLAMLVALRRQEQVKGLVGIASAPDFTEKLIWQQLGDAQKTQLQTQGVIHLPSCYGEAPYPITATLIKEARAHLLLDKPIPLAMPVRLLHGTHDQDVPWQTSVALLERLDSADVTLTLVKNGDHRLSNAEQLAQLCRHIETLF